MYIRIGSTEYTEIKNLSFSPEADITGVTCPVNEFTADIITSSPLAPGGFAELYDDLDSLWARYWITDSVKLNSDTLRITAKSLLWPLDKVVLPAVMYEDAAVMDVLDEIFGMISEQYDLDSSFATQFIDGFCPEQSARERLQWVCFVIGGYVKTHFTDVVEILPVPTETAIIPPEKTFWRPELSSRVAVASIRAKVWSYTEGTPAATDKWVTDGTTTWVAQEQWISLNNPSAGQLSPSSVVSIEDVTLINSGNVGAILNRLSGYYFKPREVSLDVIDNGEYVPGDKVQVFTDDASIVEGWIDAAAFSFGVQARASLHVTALDPREAGDLTLIYTFNQLEIEKHTYHFPVGYEYEFQNPYFDRTYMPRRYILRPYTEITYGVMPAESVVVYVPCLKALVHHYMGYDMETSEDLTDVLEIISVDELAQDAEGVVTIT